ncbi:MAG: hypothetical protein ACRDGH_02330 [Candidatus Limnocylindria bacterium]
MSRSERETTRIVRSWLEEGVTQLPDRVLDQVLDQLPTTPQRRATGLARRTFLMSNTARIALAAAAVVVVALIGYQFLAGPNTGGPGSVPSPTPTATTALPSSEPTAQPSAEAIDTATWTTYVSDRYGFSIAHPADWSVRPGDHDWTPEESAWESTATESFIAPDESIRISAWSVAVEPGTSLEAWIQAYCERNTTPCTGIQERAVPVYAEVRDQHPGLLVPFTDDIQAFFLNADRIYVVASWRPEGVYDSRRLIEAFALSMCLGSPAFPCSIP